MRFRTFWVNWDTHFFFKNFCERKARNAHEQSEPGARRKMGASKASEARSAKPEGAKQPSSPAGLAGRSAERVCKLVFTNSFQCYLVTCDLAKRSIKGHSCLPASPTLLWLHRPFMDVYFIHGPIFTNSFQCYLVTCELAKRSIKGQSEDFTFTLELFH